jgi:hypothetical protein
MASSISTRPDPPERRELQKNDLGQAANESSMAQEKCCQEGKVW